MAQSLELRRSPSLERPNMSNTQQVPECDHPEDVSVTGNQKLHLVLCGSDETLKKSISKNFRGKRKFLRSITQKEKTCVRKDLKIHGRQISLVELPALNHLSEEEVMLHTLNCVSLCDPGVHVFLLIVPDAPLTDEDKAEIEKIQKSFSSGIHKHVMVLIVQEKKVISKKNLDPLSTDTYLQAFKEHRFVLKNSSKVPALLQDVEKMVRENKGSFYTTFMCLQDRIEVERNKHRAEIEKLRSIMKTQSGVILDGVRIVLLGKTGAGKSATGNTILRREAFTSKTISGSVTRECQKETSEFNRRQITVIDTPGLFDTGVDHVETKKEIVKCVSMAAPGPHVFLLVIQLGRFTQEEKDAVKMIQDTFGDKSRMYTMVLFTRGDDLKKTTIEEFIEGDDSLQYLIHQCGKRYHVFNNNETKDRKQVSELLDKIDCLVAANGGSFYTNEMFQQLEKNIKEEQERIMKEKEEEIKKKEEEQRDKNQAEIEKMKEVNERERQVMQNEFRKREEELKKKEEEIKKETNENLQKELQKQLEEQQKRFQEDIKTKEKALEEQQQKFIKYLEEHHEREKQKLEEKIQRETREQAEREFHEKLEKELAKALKEAEDNLPYSAKLAREWSQSGVLSFYEYIVLWTFRLLSKHEAQNKTDE